MRQTIFFATSLNLLRSKSAPEVDIFLMEKDPDYVDRLESMEDEDQKKALARKLLGL